MPSTLLAERSFFPMGTVWTEQVHPMHDFQLSLNLDRYLSGSMHVSGGVTTTATSPLGRFQMWHRRKALACISIHFDKGEKILQILQSE
jgi:hypothetical protein